MSGSVALLGTFETKKAELQALSLMLAGHGLAVVPFDLSLASDGAVLPGEEKLRRMADAVERACAGLAEVEPGAVLAIGGGTGSEMALRAMRALPLGLPKFMITTLPFDGGVTLVTLSVSPSRSLSFASTSMFKLASSSSVRISSTATGASLVGSTVRLTVAVALPPSPSLMVYVKLSPPW